MDGSYVSDRLMQEIGRLGINPEYGSNCRSPSNCRKLHGVVADKLTAMGVEGADEAALECIVGYADVLCKKWHGSGVMADRMIKRWLRAHDSDARARGGSGTGTDPERREDGDERGGSGSGGEAPERDGGDGQSQGEGGSGEGSPEDGESEDGSGTGDGSDPDEGDGDGDGGSGSGDGTQRMPEGSEEGSDEEDPEDGEDQEEEEDDQEEEDGTEEEQEKEQDARDQPQDGQEEPPQEDVLPEYEFEDGWIPPSDFAKMVECVRMGFNLALYGPAGCGKTEILVHVAQVLDVPIYITEAPQMSYDITGFVDAKGEFVPTPFSLAFENGGIAAVDEMDRATPEALIAMNAPVANGLMYHPGLRREVGRHRDCVFMATLNTVGLGASQEYNTANKLDASTRDRFIWFRVGYEERIDLAVAKGDRNLVSFAQDWRQACDRAEVYDAICSYRVVRDFKRLCESPHFGVMDAIDKCLVKGGVPKETCETILRYMTRDNRYHKAFREYVRTMEAAA